MNDHLSKNNAKNLILITIIAFVLLSSNIGGLYIYALDEAKNSVCAREMLERGDLIKPTFNQELRTDKPPLHYYFMQLAYLIFGVNAFAARFFSSLMGVLTLLTAWWIARRYLGGRAALWTGLTLAASLHYVLQFHMAVPDPYLIFFLTAGWAAFFVFWKEEKPAYLLMAYILFGLGSLTKGPIAIALPGLSILIFLILTGKLTGSYLLKLRPLWILAVLVLIVMPWYILVGIRTDGEWLREFFFHHNINRYTNTMEGHGAIFLATPLMVLVGMFPLSIFVIQAVKRGWKDRKIHPVLLYSLIIVLTIVVFFSISSTKLPNYTVPAYPWLAVLTGYFLHHLQEKFRQYKKGVVISESIYVVLMMAIPPAIYLALKADPLMNELKYLAGYFLILPLGGIAALIFALKDQFKGSMLAVVLSWVITTLLFFYLIFPKVDRLNPVARTLPLIDTDQPIAVYRLYNPAFSFYIPKPFTPISDEEALKAYIESNPGGYIITRKSYAANTEGFDQLRKVAEAKDIFEIPTTVIYALE